MALLLRRQQILLHRASLCRQAYSSGPSPNFLSNQSPELGSSHRISDMEWNIRTGRAVALLKESLPSFFEAGLVSSAEDTESSIYANNLRLRYTPPAPLPAPFPQTLQVEGLPLYHASAVFVKHTLAALYNDIDINIRNVNDRSHGSRNRSLEIYTIVSGKLRVTGKRSEWDVKSIYNFCSDSGLINLHIVDSIIPAPHQAVYDSLRSSIIRIIGPQHEPQSVPCPTTSDYPKCKI